ncbi:MULTISPECIES: MarR family winged helix-turn-helix transcriptional regulator [Nocardia]|uniref:MarR family winged helix-turn-helix transcriptional regulator n=1 Tax=Nocardia TaxID=1817 RepID=UPI001E3D2022|nr:MarR family transcriptional regulator [Nocardia asteroides]UGT60366.1 MarR family transcriptional regulator [Nocardia asteroides]
MVRWLSDDEQTTWQAFIRLNQRLDAAIAQGLAKHGLSTPDYELMVALSAAPDGALRAKDLAAEVCWEKSRLSKHLARMAGRGLVERKPVADDARGVLVVLTEQGRSTLELAAPSHVELVRRLFVDALSADEARSLRSLAAKVVTRSEAEVL